MPRDYYVLPAVYQAELNAIWGQSWLFAGHSVEIPEPGDFLLVRCDGASILLIRDADGSLHGMHNLCRHRGMPLVADERGTVERLVCPYHQWVYERDGRLRTCRGMPPGTNKEGLGLKPVAVRETAGLVFFSLARQPPTFEIAEQQFSDMAGPQGLARAKVAATIDYEIEANWKIVWENNRECYHCDVNHPEYIRANFDRYEGELAASTSKRLAAATQAHEQSLAEQGLRLTDAVAGLCRFPDPAGRVWFSANRTPLAEGWVSETLDGRRAAPRMGDYQRDDVGTLRLRSLPNFWNHSSCDHAVSTRLLPLGIARTQARVTWLVDADAVEGRDYTLERLLPFWQRTSEQDWELCRRVQQGVALPAYEPGPLSPDREYNLESFLVWYIAALNNRDQPPRA